MLWCLHILGAITSFKATSASKLTVEFDKAVPATAELVITKGADKVDGKLSWNEGRTVATFESTGNFSYGEYTVTVTDGTSTPVTANTTVEAEKVAEIKILNKTALTGGSKTVSGASINNVEAYIYYDVYNQYGESIRNSTSINWTVSSCDSKVENKSTGLITAVKDKEAFTYGTVIYITGVNVKSGVAVSESVTVGMEQAIDSVEFAGFVSKDDKTKKIDALPNDFAKGTYSLLYTTYDQNHNVMPAQADNIDPEDGKGSRLTFISDNVLMVKSEFKDGDVYTIDGVEYSSVKIEPGMYVDKGGEVNITAISNKTGGKTTKNFVIGTNGLLKSMTIGTPSSTVADGDTNVEIPFTAKDADGNTITNYETIARSSNSINLTATEGTLVLYEKNDGTAGLRWNDDMKYCIGYHEGPITDWSLGAKHITSNPYTGKYNYADYNDLDSNGNPTVKSGEIDIDNEVDRNISLTTVVIGGESDNIILPVSDMRRPAAISKVKLNDDDNDTIIADGSATVDFIENITYLDQYGKELPDIAKKAFWEASKNNNGIVGDYEYAIHVERSNANMLKSIEGKEAWITNGGIVYNPTDDSATEPATSTLKYAVAARKTNETQFNDISKVKSVTYNIVPMTLISDFYITNIPKLGVTTDYSESDNGNDIANITTGSAINGSEGDLNIAAGNRELFVKSTYKGLTLTVPNQFIEATDDRKENNKDIEGSSFNIVKDGAYKCLVNSVKGGKLQWRELYDVNSAKNNRKDATKKLELKVNVGENNAPVINKNITISDAEPLPASITFTKGYNALENDTFNPALTNISLGFVSEGTAIDTLGECEGKKHMLHQWNSPNTLFANVIDQYGDLNYDRNILYTVSDVKENNGAFSHKPDSFTVSMNGSKDTRISGAELGDTFTLTATVENSNISDTLKVTVGADGYANVKSGDSTTSSADYSLRQVLGYDR